MGIQGGPRPGQGIEKHRLTTQVVNGSCFLYQADKHCKPHAHISTNAPTTTALSLLYCTLTHPFLIEKNHRTPKTGSLQVTQHKHRHRSDSYSSTALSGPCSEPVSLSREPTSTVSSSSGRVAPARFGEKYIRRTRKDPPESTVFRTAGFGAIKQVSPL